MAWVVDDRTLSLIALLFVLRVAATAATLVAGGVGGLVHPLATLGVVMGEFVGEALGEAKRSSTRSSGSPPSSVPATGRRSPRSCSLPNRQAAWVPSSCRAGRRCRFAARRRAVIGCRSPASAPPRLSRAPLHTAAVVDSLNRRADRATRATVSEFVYFHVLARRERAVPVVDGGTYVGMAASMTSAN